MRFIDNFKIHYPAVEAGLNKKAFSEFSGSLKKYQHDLPDSFLYLYKEYDGENSRTPGIFAGFSWMSNAQIVADQAILANTISEKYSNLPHQIQEVAYADYWIPFAHDHSGSYLAVDVNPGTKGNKGQVISLDRNSDEVYVIAKSFDDFCHFIFESIANEKIIIEQEDENLLCFWKSGHLFNDLNVLHASTNSENIVLTGYWRDYFKNKSKDSKIAISDLEKISQLVVNERNTDYKGPVSFDILRYCTNLTELICHSNSVVSFESLTALSKLKKFYVRSAAFTKDSLTYLSKCTSLKDLGLISMNLDSFAQLAGLPIKTLALVNSQLEDFDSILLLKDLSELRIEGLYANSYTVIGNLKKLKILNFKNVNLANLDFLKGMKLAELRVNNIAVDNQYDALVASIDSLKETDWPFSDISLLQSNSTLNSIGINAKTLCNIEALRDTNISSITVFNATSEENAKTIIDQVEQYKKLSSYGFECGWKH